MTVKKWLEHKSIKALVEKIQKAISTPKVNPQTGEINMKYDPMNVQEDFYLYQRAEPEDDSITLKSEQQ